MANELWVRDLDGNLIAVFGELKVSIERVGDKLVFRCSRPVLYRRDQEPSIALPPWLRPGR